MSKDDIRTVADVSSTIHEYLVFAFSSSAILSLKVRRKVWINGMIGLGVGAVTGTGRCGLIESSLSSTSDGSKPPQWPTSHYRTCKEDTPVTQSVRLPRRGPVDQQAWRKGC